MMTTLNNLLIQMFGNVESFKAIIILNDYFSNHIETILKIHKQYLI